MLFFDDSDGYEFEIPEELRPWMEHQREKERKRASFFMSHYMLVNGKIKLANSLLEWAKWFENGENRRVDRTTVGESDISTVFLSLDHNFGGMFIQFLNSNIVLFCLRQWFSEGV